MKTVLDDVPDGNFVLIPCDRVEPMRELMHAKNTTLEDDDLREVLKLHFARIKPLNATYQDDYKEAVKAQFVEQQKKSGDNNEIDDETITRFAKNISVDTYPLTIPTKEYPYAISIYCDAKAQAKSLPLNPRACGLAAACGAKNQQFRGDLFVSRYFDDDEQWLRQDFRLNDCNSQAEWIIRASSTRPSNNSSSLSDMYKQLTSDTDDQKKGEPISIDARQMEIDAMNSQHDEHGFSWTQTSEDLEIRIPLPEDIQFPKRQINIALNRQAITVIAITNKLLVSPKLYAPIDLEVGYSWTLDKEICENDNIKTSLVITLSKLDTDSPPWPVLGEITTNEGTPEEQR